MALLTMALLTMALLTTALLTMALLTTALLTMALLTMALLTMAVVERRQHVALCPLETVEEQHPPTQGRAHRGTVGPGHAASAV
eukprot:scaffold50123_cov24-Phaeocystis_antarctica.AAC.1